MALTVPIKKDMNQKCSKINILRRITFQGLVNWSSQNKPRSHKPFRVAVSFQKCSAFSKYCHECTLIRHSGKLHELTVNQLKDILVLYDMHLEVLFLLLCSYSQENQNVKCSKFGEKLAQTKYKLYSVSHLFVEFFKVEKHF